MSESKSIFPERFEVTFSCKVKGQQLRDCVEVIKARSAIHAMQNIFHVCKANNVTFVEIKEVVPYYE